MDKISRNKNITPKTSKFVMFFSAMLVGITITETINKNVQKNTKKPFRGFIFFPFFFSYLISLDPYTSNKKQCS